MARAQLALPGFRPRSSERGRVGRPLISGLALAVILVSAGPATAMAGWTRPFSIAPPSAFDLVPAHVALTVGAAAVGYGVEDVDSPSSATALFAQRRGRGGFAPARSLSGAQQVLALAYRGRDLELLVGGSEAGRPCCSIVRAVGPVRGASARSRTLFSGLAGATLARLVALPGRLLAVVGTERGVWAAQSAPGGERFGSPRRLSDPSQLPQSVDAVSLPGGGDAVAWTARTDQVTSPGPRSLYLARGSQRQAPGAGRLLLKVPAGHGIDELTLAAGASAPAVAWIESWYDRGGYHARVNVADLGATLHPRVVSSPHELAAGLAFAADDHGDQALTWKGCNGLGGCAVRVLLRRAGGRFGAVGRPGGIDAAQSPEVTVTAAGRTVVGWIQAGHVLAATSAGPRLGGAHTVSGTSYAADLALAGGPGSEALAVWTQGTLAQSLVGADWR